MKKIQKKHEIQFQPQKQTILKIYWDNFKEPCKLIKLTSKTNVSHLWDHMTERENGRTLTFQLPKKLI